MYIRDFLGVEVIESKKKIYIYMYCVKKAKIIGAKYKNRSMVKTNLEFPILQSKKKFKNVKKFMNTGRALVF